MKYVAIINHFDEEATYKETTVEDAVFDSRDDADSYILMTYRGAIGHDGEYRDNENRLVIEVVPKPFTLFEPGETIDIEELHCYVDPDLAQYTIINLNSEINYLKEKIERLEGTN